MNKHAWNFKDLSGEKFGRLLVLEVSYKDNNGHYYWKCQCDCGKIKNILGTHLLRKNIISCGCYASEESSKRAKSRQLVPNKRIRNIWKLMQERCYNPKSVSYKNYGKKGIQVCDEWKNNIKLFYEWSINNGYKDNLSLDRIDFNKNYQPDNCRWVEWKEQCNNKRTNIKIKYKGEIQNVSYFIKKYNLNKFAIYSRLKNGWSVKDAIEKPIRERKKNGAE